MSEIKSDDRFKYILAADFIAFLFDVWTKGEQSKIDTATVMLESWSKQVEVGAATLRKKMARKIVESSDDPLMAQDVAEIMLDITNTDNKLLKQEFMLQIMEVIHKRVAVES